MTEFCLEVACERLIQRANTLGLSLRDIATEFRKLADLADEVAENRKKWKVLSSSGS